LPFMIKKFVSTEDEELCDGDNCESSEPLDCNELELINVVLAVLRLVVCARLVLELEFGVAFDFDFDIEMDLDIDFDGVLVLLATALADFGAFILRVLTDFDLDLSEDTVSGVLEP